VLFGSFPQNGEGMILSADFILGLLVLLAKGLVLISLNTDRSRLDVTVVRTLN